MKTIIKVWAVIILTLFVCTTFTVPAHAAPPENFQSNLIIGSGLEGPSGFEFSPDGRIFILQRTGEVLVYKNGSLLPNPFVVLPSAASGDRGLIGITFDPDFVRNHWVYFYYTSTDLHNYLVRCDASTDVCQNGPFVIYQTTAISNQLHVGGTVAFGPDGKIYLSIGENGYPPNAQDLTNPHGKILRINKDGSIPTDNPFYGQAGKAWEIWAYGLRNPFRFSFDSETGDLIAGDVGNETWEEVNKIRKGANYGWPICEGICTPPQSGMTNPLYYYKHDTLSSAITGGFVYRGSMFPSPYAGSYFFGDYARGFLRRLTFDANGAVIGNFDFDTNAGTVVELKMAADGSLYYLTIYPGELYRITYSTTSHLPIANASADKTKGTDPMTVQFSSSGSSDPDKGILTYAWEFGDGTKSTLANPTHIYQNKGSFIAKLSVTNATGTSQAVPIVIQVGLPPKVTIGQPTDGTTYVGGDTINYTISAVDGVGNDLNDSKIVSNVLFHHLTHIHPFLGPLTGRTGTFTIPVAGEPSSETYFEIQATATDENGLSTTTSVFIYPKKVNITLASNIAGALLYLDGSPIVTNLLFQSIINFQRELSVPFLQLVDNLIYTFDHWSDNLAPKHTVSTPSTDTAYTAYFRQTEAFKGEYFSNATLSGTPTMIRQDSLIDFAWGDNAPTISLPENDFSIRWSKMQYFAEGKYTFTSATDDGLRLYVDGKLVIDEWHPQGETTHTGSIDLQTGDHLIVMEYYDVGFTAVARLSWDYTGPLPAVTPTPTPTNTPTPMPTPTPVPGQFTASYWNTPSISSPLIPTTAPVFTESVPNVYFNWKDGSPDTKVQKNNFAARYTKIQEFTQTTQGKYRFDVVADDGVRVLVDSVKVIDMWSDHPPTNFTGTIDIPAGFHTITVEYYENGGDAVIELIYTKIGDLTTPTPTPTPAGEEKVIYDEELGSGWLNWSWSSTNDFANTNAFRGTKAIKYTPTGTWSGVGLHFLAGINTTPFTHITVSIKATSAMTEKFVMYTKNAENKVTEDVLLPLKNYGGNPTSSAWKTYTIPLTDLKANGKVIREVGIYDTSEKIQEPLFIDEWKIISTNTPPLPVEKHGLTANYFPNLTLSGTPALIRIDPEVDFSWWEASPDASLPKDDFSVRWTGFIVPEFSETYTFTTTTDDGVRLWVNDQLIVDHWNNQSATDWSGTIQLQANQRYTIKMEYYDKVWDAIVKLHWASPSRPKQIVPESRLFSE